MTKKVLNVGGNSKAIALPAQYAGFEHLLLDIDPRGNPDICCDARELSTLTSDQFDAVYCSHNLEHYFHHDVGRVLAGFMHVLKPGGFAQVRVPDMNALFQQVVERQLDIEDVLYVSPAGPITVLDVIYGYGVEIERSGNDFFGHKTGFTEKSLLRVLRHAGFGVVAHRVSDLEIDAVAFKGKPNPEHVQRLGLVLPS